MSINCTEKGCKYQKDGICFLNTIKPQMTSSLSSVCYYFYNNKSTMQEISTQSQQKSPHHISNKPHQY